MITSPAVNRPIAGKPPAGQRGRSAENGPGGRELGKSASREAQRRAALVLEVLAGSRTPTEAAQALAVGVPRYYQLESQALRGLLAACEPVRPGRVASVTAELASLRRDKERLQREVVRQQALVRAAQRTIGLAPPVPRNADKKTRVRRKVRALRVAGRLQEQVEALPAEVPATDS